MPDEQSQSRRFDDMRKQIDGIATKQDSTSRNVYKILALLEGDDFAEGMVSAVKDHELRIAKLEKIKDKTTWVIMGMSIPTGYGIVEIAKKFWPQIIGGLVILLLFTSCITQKKREDIFHRHARENPADVLEYCEPPGLVYKPGRVDTIPGDTVYIQPDSVDCPDGTVIRPEPVAVPCPPSTRQVDTVTVRDMNEERRLALLLADKERHNAVLEDRFFYKAKQARNRLYWIIGISIVLGISVISRFKL